MTTGYEYYFARLDGRNVAPRLDTPECGFYRDRDDYPVAFFHDASVTSGAVPSLDEAQKLTCVRAIDGGFQVLDSQEAKELWNWVCVHPVTEESWRTVANGLGNWPDSINAPGMGHNQPSDRVTVVDEAETWLKGVEKIETKAVADKAAAHIKRLRNVYTDLELEEKAAKEPYNDFIATIRDNYKKLREPIGVLGLKIKTLLTPFLLAEDARIAKERQAIAEANRAAQQSGERPTTRKPTASAGRTGSKVIVRTYRSAEITDYARALRTAQDEPEVREAVQTIADRFARGVKDGMAETEISALLLPGTKLKEEKRV